MRHSEAWMSQAEESNEPCARILATGSSVSSAAVARRRLMWFAMLDGSRAAAVWIERFGHSWRWLHEYVAGTASGGRYLLCSPQWLRRGRRPLSRPPPRLQASGTLRTQRLA